MAKKLLLVFGTLCVLIGGLVVYRMYLGADFQPPGSNGDPVPVVQPGGEMVGGLAVGNPEGIWHAPTDPVTGRRLAVYRCARWEAGNPHILTEPDIELYPRSGQTVYISARKATIVADEAAGDLVLRRGELIDEVDIRVDLNRLPEDQKPPLEQRPGDCIAMGTKTVAFDIDLQELRAPGHVAVDGKNVHISGEDLLLQWHSAPDEELRTLRLARGERMKIDTRSELLRGGPRERTAAGRPAARRDGPLPTSQPADEPAARAYSIFLIDNVTVTVGSRSMQGCDRVKLVFSTQQGSGLASMADDEAPAATQPAAPPARATTEPATAPAVAGEMVVITWTGPLMMVPFDAAKADGPPPPADEFELYAEGANLQLIEADVDGTMTARCGSLTYASESQTTRLIAPDTEGGQVELTLANGDRVVSESMRIERKAGQLVLYMIGPGSMAFDTAEREMSVAGLGVRPAPAETQPAEPIDEQGGRIAWSEGVQVLCAGAPDEEGRFIPKQAHFTGDVSFAAGDGSSMAADEMTVHFEPRPQPTSRPAVEGVAGDDGSAMPTISRVEAVGEVRLEVAEGGDNVTADRLDIEMGVLDSGEVYPLKADATGSVVGAFDGSEISADTLTVDFEPSSDPTRRAEPTAMTAVGDVVLTDTTAERPVRATGGHLDCDLVAGRYVMTGQPAKMAYGDEWLSGPEIVLTLDEVDRKRHLREAVVVGEGLAKILLSRDLSGAELAEPAPGMIRWNDRMRYTPDADALVFTGDVAFDSAAGIDTSPDDPVPVESIGDHLRCGELTLTLESDDEAGLTRRPDAAAGPIVDTQRKVRSIVATENVRLLSRRHDDEDYLISRLQVTGDHLNWDAIGSEISVDGPGTLSLEDYRAADPTDVADDALDPAKLDRPGITAFQWQDRMHLVQALWQAPTERQADQPSVWTATMDGQVMMRHRSGMQIQGVERLPIRLPDPMPVGRVAELDCGHVLARFISTDNELAGATANLTLNLFEAVGDVVFRDGPYEAQGGRIVYDQEEQVAVVYGSETADPDDPTPAIVTREAPGGASGFDTVSSPVITVLRDGESYRMTALKAVGIGSR